MENSAAPDRQQTLPILALVLHSYRLAWERRGLLITPLLLLFTLDLIIAQLFHQSAAVGALLRALLQVLVALLTLSFIVGLHRNILLDEQKPGIAFLSWTADRWRYLGSSIKIFVSLALLSALTMTLPAIVAFHLNAPRPLIIAMFGLLLLLVMGFSVRWTLALPAAAIGQDNSLRAAWRVSSAQWPRLLAATLLASLPFLAVLVVTTLQQMLTIILQGRTLAPIQAPGAEILLVIGALAKTLSVPVATALISLSYDFLVRRQPDPVTPGDPD